MPGLLQDRVVIVTGAGRGIGAGIARLVAREGAQVVVNDLGTAVDGVGADATPMNSVVAEIIEAGGAAVANGSDVSNYEAAGELVQQALETYGRLDVLINVAGILRDKMIFKPRSGGLGRRHQRSLDRNVQHVEACKCLLAVDARREGAQSNN